MTKTEHFNKILREFDWETDREISYREQLEIEHSCAEAIRETKPFSEERQEITRLGYEAVDRILTRRAERNGTKLASYGACDAYFSMLDRLLEHYMLSHPAESCGPICFYEGGVGTGAVLKHLAEQFKDKVRLAGCDVYLDRYHLGSLQLGCVEDTLYHALKAMPDESIDVFYWNDVMEHMPEDEIQTLLQLLSQKLAKGGILITITPGKGMGPHDVTYHVDPYAATALGLHLREYYFYEICDVMKEAGLAPYAFARRKGGHYKIQYDNAAKRYRHDASAEKSRLKFAYLFSGMVGKVWRKLLMWRFTNTTVFVKP